MTDTFKTSVLIAEYLAIEKSIADKVKRMEDIKEELRDAAPHGKTAFDNIGHVTISDNVTYPAAAVMADLTDGQKKRCMSMQYDSKKAAANYPAQFKAARKEGGLKVSVKKH